MQQPQLGQIGLYEIDNEIGRSSSAVVYRALNTSLQYPVALKVLRSGFAHNRAVARYFIAEGQDGMRLIHPNIVRVYDAGQSDEVAFIAQSLVEGMTLAQQMERQDTTIFTPGCDPDLRRHCQGVGICARTRTRPRQPKAIEHLSHPAWACADIRLSCGKPGWYLAPT